MYKTIVVGTDGSGTADKAVQTAAQMARTLGAALHVVTASGGGPLENLGNVVGAPMVGTGAERLVREEAAGEVGQKAVESWGEGLDVHPHARSGDPADVILELAHELGADLVVVGSKGMHGARRFLGSVPNSVCHGAECAVLVVKTD
ncbi:MAG: universal stress protein [Acidimicrobiales bacterium]